MQEAYCGVVSTAGIVYTVELARLGAGCIRGPGEEELLEAGRNTYRELDETGCKELVADVALHAGEYGRKARVLHEAEKKYGMEEVTGETSCWKAVKNIISG